MSHIVMTNEVWKDIEGYDGRYMVSSLGRVKNCQRNKVLSPWVDASGYLKVSFKDCGVQTHYSVHRLVACAFIPNESELPTVDHKDGDKRNNSTTNLRWCTQEDNARWDNSQTFTMRSPSGELVTFHNMTEFCRANGLTQPNLHKVFTGERKSHKGWTNA